VVVGRMILDQNGTRIFKKDGSLYQDIPPDSVYQRDYNNLKALTAQGSTIPLFSFPPTPDQTTINAVSQNGGTFTSLAGNKWQINFGSVQTLFDPSNKVIITSTYESGLLTEQRTQSFTTTEQGILAPLENRVERSIIRPSGLCMQQVVRERYSNYYIAMVQERNDGRTGLTAPGSWVAPNPSTGVVTLYAGESVIPGSVARVMNIAGVEIYMQGNVRPLENYPIHLEKLPDGLYFIQLNTTIGIQVLKLVKKSD